MVRGTYISTCVCMSVCVCVPRYNNSHYKLYFFAKVKTLMKQTLNRGIGCTGYQVEKKTVILLFNILKTKYCL